MAVVWIWEWNLVVPRCGGTWTLSRGERSPFAGCVEPQPSVYEASGAGVCAPCVAVLTRAIYVVISRVVVHAHESISGPWMEPYRPPAQRNLHFVPTGNSRRALAPQAPARSLIGQWGRNFHKVSGRNRRGGCLFPFPCCRGFECMVVFWIWGWEPYNPRLRRAPRRSSERKLSRRACSISPGRP